MTLALPTATSPASPQRASASTFPRSSPYVTVRRRHHVQRRRKHRRLDTGTAPTHRNGGSALSYIPEQPWNETTASGGLTAGGAGGGGASAYFSKPAWQVGTGVPSDGSRDVPDISLNAAAVHDGYLVCSQATPRTSLPAPAVSLARATDR